MPTLLCHYCLTEKIRSDFKAKLKEPTQCLDCNRSQTRFRRSLNKEKWAAYNREYRKKNEYTIKGKSSALLTSMRSRTSSNGYSEEVEWSKEEIESTICGRCEVTGIKFDISPTQFNKNPWAPSPDRIDNTKGYTKENTQWVVWAYNSMKQDYTKDIVTTLITAIIKTHQHLAPLQLKGVVTNTSRVL